MLFRSTIIDGKSTVMVYINYRWRLEFSIWHRTRGRIEIEAAVESVTANTIQLRLFDGSVTVLVDNNARLDDDTGVTDKLSISDLRAGDFVEVEFESQDSQDGGGPFEDNPDD